MWWVALATFIMSALVWYPIGKAMGREEQKMIDAKVLPDDEV